MQVGVWWYHLAQGLGVCFLFSSLIQERRKWAQEYKHYSHKLDSLKKIYISWRKYKWSNASIAFLGTTPVDFIRVNTWFERERIGPSLKSSSQPLFYLRKKIHKNIFPWSYTHLFFNTTSTARLVWTYPHQDFVWTTFCIFGTVVHHSMSMSAHTLKKAQCCKWKQM